MMKSVEANDVTSLLDLYAPDVIFMGDAYPTLEGIDKLKLYSEWLADIATFSIDTEKVDLLGSDHVLQRGKLDAITVDGSVWVDGKILLFWKKIGEDWKIEIEMFNNDSK